MYKTINGNTVLDIREVVYFAFSVDEETKKIDKKLVNVVFRSGFGIQLIHKTQKEAQTTFDQLYNLLKDERKN